MNRVEARSSANKSLATAVAQGTKLEGCAVTASGKASAKTFDRVLYVTAEIKGAGKIEAFKAISKQAIGVTNFNRNQLASMQNAVIDSATLEYGTLTKASATGSFEDEVQNVSFKKAAPDWLLNSEVRFSCGQRLLIDLPGYELHNVNTGNSREDEYRGIGDLPIIEAQKACEFEVETPTNANIDTSTDRHFVRFAMRVSKTGERL